MPEPTFGAELRRLRLAVTPPMGQDDLAWIVGLSPQYVSDLAMGRRTPNQRVVHKLTVAFEAAGQDTQALRELAFRARGECCPRCGFGASEEE